MSSEHHLVLLGGRSPRVSDHDFIVVDIAR